MKKEVVITYDEKDYELLRVSALLKLPSSPCIKCSLEIGCCGCKEYDRYKSAWKPYEDAGIKDIAKKLLRRIEIKQEISKLEEEFNELTNQIPSQFVTESNYKE